MPTARAVLRIAVALVGMGTFASGCAPAAPETPGTETPVPALVVSSAAFADGGTIPSVHCRSTVDGGEDVSVPLAWSDAPEQTRSFVITMIDRHPVARDWVHWVVVDVPAEAAGIPAGASANGAGSTGAPLPSGARELDNGFGETGYGGPAPPPGTGAHDYELTVYALDVATLDVGDHPSAADIERAVDGHVLARGSVTGFFGR